MIETLFYNYIQKRNTSLQLSLFFKLNSRNKELAHRRIALLAVSLFSQKSMRIFYDFLCR